jgi:hypothetical protein
VELDELRLGLATCEDKAILSRFVVTVNMRCVHLAKSLTKASHACGSLYIVRPKGDFDVWYKKECLYGICSTHGVGKFPFCSKELNGIDERPIQCKRCALEETISKNGKPLKKLTLAYKNTSLDEFIEYLKPKLQLFVRHNFVARWQDKHYNTCVKSFSINYIVSIVDFVENYNFEVQNEVQSMH